MSQVNLKNKRRSVNNFLKENMGNDQFTWILVIFTVLPWKWTGCEAHMLPSTFKTHEEPSYEVIANLSKNVEERKYSAKNWACTAKTEEPSKIDDQISDMLTLLFNYIQGANEGDNHIEMTVPVTRKIVQVTEEENEYTICFYIPENFQQDPPQPKHEKVAVVAFPVLHIYSRRYSGYTTKNLEVRYLTELQDILKTKEISFYEQGMGLNATHFVNGYDSPIKTWNRRNEVWILAKT